METPCSKDELEKLKDYAKILYTRDRLTQEEVSEKTGLHHNTISKWSIEGGWKKLRRSFITTREEQMARMLDELIELNDKIANGREAVVMPTLKKVRSGTGSYPTSKTSNPTPP